MDKNYKELLIKEIENIEDEDILRFLYVFAKDFTKSETEHSVSDMS